MFLCIVVRGGTGTLIWDRISTGLNTANWVCQRDGFSLQAPHSAAEANAFLVSLNQHSVSLVGNVAQVVQLEL